MKVYDKEMGIVTIIDKHKFDKTRYLTQEQYEQKLKEVLDDENEFRKKLAEVENKINSLIQDFEKNRTFLINNYGGKRITKEAMDKLMKLFRLNISPFSLAEKIDEVDIKQPVDNLIKELTEIKDSFVPDKNCIYVSDIYLCENLECYDDDDYYLSIDVQIDFFEIREKIPPYELSKIREEEIGKIFDVEIMFDCESFKDFLEGDLTKKGLFKRINLFNDNQC